MAHQSQSILVSERVVVSVLGRVAWELVAMVLRNRGGCGLGLDAAASLLAVVVAALLDAGVVVGASRFDDVVQPSWANDHIVYDGDLLKLRLDSSSGGRFTSKNKFLYSKVSADLKLVSGDSTEVVTAFYRKVPEVNQCWDMLAMFANEKGARWYESNEGREFSSFMCSVMAIFKSLHLLQTQTKKEIANLQVIK